MHADEAVQAARFRPLWLEGRYRYDPDEFHGPTLSYATLPAAWLSGAGSFADTTATTYRIVTALFGGCLIVLIWWLGDALGRPAAAVAAGLAAVSPAMVFYSRYYIHETLLVFFTLAAVTAAWRYTRSGRFAWCLAAGACLGLMQATKETSVLAFLAAAVASTLSVLFDRAWRQAENRDGRPWRGWHVAVSGLVAVATASLVLSSFGTNPRGPLDGVLTYVPWLTRAGGASPHVHPWYFYWQRLGWWQVGDGPRWSEGLILALAAAGLAGAWGLGGRGGWLPGADRRAVRWLGFYTVVLAAGYSVIPYKTPWCALQFLWGLILLAGVGAAVLVRAAPGRPLKAALILVLVSLSGQLAWQSWRTSFVLPADPRNPWVYAHTSPGIERLQDDVQQLAAAAGDEAADGDAVDIKVIWHGGYYWPLPWYLRRLEHVQYWTHVPPDPRAALVLSTPEYDAELTAVLDETHLMTGYYALRPTELVQLWVRMDVWEAHLRRLGRL